MAVTSSLVDNATRTSSTGTAATVSGASFGSAASGRVLVVPWFSNDNGADPIAATIGGISATILGTGVGVGLIYAVVGTGTSGDIVFTCSPADTISTNGVVALLGAASATPSDTIANGSSGSGSIDIGAGGSLVAFGVAFSSGTWTGVTALRTDSSIGGALSTASFDNSGTALTGRSVSYSGAIALFAAAFDAAAGGGGTGVTASPTGNAGTGSAGSVTVSGKANITPAKVTGTSHAGTVSVSGKANVSLTGAAGTGAAASPTVAGTASVAPDGVEATGGAGDPGISGAANVTLDGVSATGEAGTPTVDVAGAVTVALTGLEATGEVGTLTATGSGALDFAPGGFYPELHRHSRKVRREIARAEQLVEKAPKVVAKAVERAKASPETSLHEPLIATITDALTRAQKMSREIAGDLRKMETQRAIRAAKALLDEIEALERDDEEALALLLAD